MAHEHQLTVDRRSVEQLEDVIHRLHLDEDNKNLLFQLKCINPDNPSDLDKQIYRAIAANVAHLRQKRLREPYRTAPSSMSSGLFTLGHQVADNMIIRATDRELAHPTIISGPTGSGKTTYAHFLAHQAIAADVRLLLIDPKKDATYFLGLYQDFLVITEDTPWNPLQRLPWLTLAKQNAMTVDCLARSTWGGHRTRDIVDQALRMAYQENENASINDLIRVLVSMHHKTDPHTWRDTVLGATGRFRGIAGFYPGIANTRKGIPIEEFARHSVLIPVKIGNEADEFLSSLFIRQCFAFNEHRNIRDTLTHLVAIDEGLLTWGTDVNRVEGPVLSTVATMTREFSIGILITSTSIRLTDPLFQSNTYLHAVVGVTDGNEATEVTRIMNLTPEQRYYMERKQQKGEVLLKFGGDYREPILARYPKLTYDKAIATEIWDAAVRRTQTLGPPKPPPISTAPPNPAAREDIGAPKSNTPPRPEAPPPIALTKHQESLLRSTIARIAPATEHYRRLGLHPQQGNRAKIHLIKNGFITCARILVRRGRGSSAVCLVATKLAIQRLNLKPPPLTRGGDSVQHRYLLQEFAFLGNVENKIGTKSCDLTWRHAEHPTLDEILSRIAHQLATNQAPIANGDLEALEIEVSDPIRTGPSNVQLNFAAGISRTIIAVLPARLLETITGLKTQLEATLRSRVLVVDALELLDALRKSDKQPPKTTGEKHEQKQQD